MNMEAGMALLLSVVAIVASGRTFELAVWRGERAAAVVPDFCELADRSPAGVEMRFGVLRKVEYAPKPRSLQRLTCYDRVEWDAAGDGPRVVEVCVPKTTLPGVYRCGMMTVRVVDRVLPPPAEWKYYLDLWQHPWAVARCAGVTPFSEGHFRAMRPAWELLASAGQKSITVSLMDRPWDHQCFDAYLSMFDDGDFGLFDKYVSFCLECGLGPDISCYSLCPWTMGREINAEELESRWGEFLTRFSTHLKKKGWFENTVMAMDERSPQDVKTIYDFVQKHAKGMRISLAGDRNPRDFAGIDVGIYSQKLEHSLLSSEFFDEAESRRLRGQITTCYVCCEPLAPNTFMWSGNGEAFWIGTAPAILGLDGFLRWAWNSWPKDPVKDASFGNWHAGDTFLCYPDGSPSWRFLDLRNGIVAAEKIRILRIWGDWEPAHDARLKSLFDVKAANDGICRFESVREIVMSMVNR